MLDRNPRTGAGGGRRSRPPPPPYAELWCQSAFSFGAGASHPETLVRRAARLGYAALALTDACSLAGVVRAHLAAKEAGLPLVVGAAFALEGGGELALLAPDREAYGDLCELVTRVRARDRAAQVAPRADLEALGGRCLALWHPPRSRRRRCGRQGPGCGRPSAIVRGLRSRARWPPARPRASPLSTASAHASACRGWRWDGC